MAEEKRPLGITIIAVGKLLKAITLIAIGIGAFAAAGHDTHRMFGRLADLVRVDPHNHYLVSAIAKISGQSARRLHEIGIGTFLYAAVFLTEGTGLWLRKHWAEWFTVGVTTSFVPLELYEIVKEPSAGKIIALLLNVVAVIYLVIHRLRKRKKLSASSGWLPQTGA